MFRRIFSIAVIFCFFLTSLTPFPKIYANTLLTLPEPGTMVPFSGAFQPAMIKGLIIHPENPLLFDFIVDPGQSGLKDAGLKTEGLKLIKYFLASLTVPENEQWVNLSPYEKNKIIVKEFGETDMGRDLLAQDYILKQVTSTAVYPEKDLGKKFWDRVYAKARALYNTSDIPVDTFNKIWIVPKSAVVYTNENNVFVVDSHLKVMLEEDYVAMNKNLGVKNYGLDGYSATKAKSYSSVTTQIIREIVLPEIEKEVNQGKNFAALRQIYNSVILATWFKNNLKESLLGQLYANHNTVNGIDIADKSVQMRIYNQYLKALKKGVFNYIKENGDPNNTQEVVARKYFSGGALFKMTPDQISEKTDFAMLTGDEQKNVPKEGTIDLTVGLATGSIENALQEKALNEEGSFPKARLSDYPDEWYKGKKVIVRADFNISGNDYTRIIAGIPTIKYLIERGAIVIIDTHLGQPKNGYEEKFALKPIYDKLAELMGIPVIFNGHPTMHEARDVIANMQPGQVMGLENTRFNKGEEAIVNAKKKLKTAQKAKDKDAEKAAKDALQKAILADATYAQELYEGADMFVLDGFSVAHRAHVSVTGAPTSIPRVAGLLVEEEIAGLSTIASKVDTVIMGGSKVVTKLPIIKALLDKETVKTLGIGGAMANAFFAAQGIVLDARNKGIEEEDIAQAKKLLADAKAMKKIILPVDVVVVSSLEPGAEKKVVDVKDIPSDMLVVDVGPKTVELFISKLGKYSFWNGPLGVFENELAAEGTKTFGQQYAAHDGYTAAGGGDTVAAINKFGITGIKYVSKAGGATEEYLAGKLLPGVELLSEPPSSAVYLKQYQKIIDAIDQVFPDALILPNVSTRKIDTSVEGNDNERRAALDFLVGPNGEKIVEIPQPRQADMKDNPGLAIDWMDFPIIINKNNIPEDLKQELEASKTPKDTTALLVKYLTKKLTGVVDFHAKGDEGTDVQSTVVKAALAISQVIAIKTGAGNFMIRMPFWFMRNEEAMAKINEVLGKKANEKKAAWEEIYKQEEAYAKKHWFENAEQLTHNSQEALQALSNYGFRFFDEFSSGNYQRAPLLTKLINLIDVTEFVAPEKYGIVYDKSIGKLISTLDKDSKIPYFGKNLQTFLASLTYVGSFSRFMNNVLMPKFNGQDNVGRVIDSPQVINAALGYYHRMYYHLLALGYNNSPKLAKMLEPERMTLGNFADRLNKAIAQGDALDINQSNAQEIQSFLATKGVILTDEEMKRLSAIMSSAHDKVWAYDILQLAEALDQDAFVQAAKYLKVGTPKQIKPSEKLNPVFFGGAGRITSMTFLQRLVNDYNAHEKDYVGKYSVQSRELNGKTDAERFASAVTTIKKMIMDEGVENSGLNIDGVLVGQMLKNGELKLAPQDKKLPAKQDMVVDIPIDAVYPVDIVIKDKKVGTVYYVNNKEFKEGMSAEENKAKAQEKWLKASGLNSIDNIPYPLVVEIDGKNVLFSAVSDGTPGGVYVGNGIMEELLDAESKKIEKETGKAKKLYDGPTMWQLYSVTKFDDGKGKEIGGATEELVRWRVGVVWQYNIRLGGNPGVIDSEQIYKKLVMPLGGGMHVFGRNADKLPMVNETGVTTITPTSCSTNGASYLIQSLLAFLGLGMQDITVIGPTLHDDTSGAVKKVFGRLMTKSTGAGDGIAQHMPGNFMATAVRTPVALEGGKVKVVGGSLYDFIMELPIVVSPELLMKWLERTSEEFPEILTIFGEKDKENGKFTWKKTISGQQTGSILLGPIELIEGKYIRLADGYDNEMSFSFQDAQMQEALQESLARQKDTGYRMSALANAGLSLPGAVNTTAKIGVVSDMAMMQGQDSKDEILTVDQVINAAKAPEDDLGGINLNSILIESVLKTNQNGKPLTINGQPVGNIRINDLMPVIIKETPVYNIQSLLGTEEDVESITN